jgi:general secretion pathway protein M
MALERLQERWDQITPRERALISIGGAVIVAAILIFSIVTIQKRLSSLSEKNESTRLALLALSRHRETLLTEGPADAQRQITADAPKLDSYLDEIINELKLQSPAYPSRKENPKGEYVEVSMDIRMPKPLTIFELKDLLERIESKDPKVVVRELNIRRNFTDKSKVDVSLVIATYKKPAAKDKEKDKEGEGS